MKIILDWDQSISSRFKFREDEWLSLYSNMKSDLLLSIRFAKFIELIAKVDNENSDVNWKKILGAHGKDINKFLSHKDDGELDAEHYTLATELIETIENFKKQFL